jgi:excisionase family DNA binding protein
MFQIQDYVTTVQAGKLLGVGRIQAFKWVKAGVLPGILFGKNYMIRKTDVERLKSDRERKGIFTHAR